MATEEDAMMRNGWEVRRKAYIRSHPEPTVCVDCNDFYSDHCECAWKRHYHEETGREFDSKTQILRCVHCNARLLGIHNPMCAIRAGANREYKATEK
jgi:hypothetical protein